MVEDILLDKMKELFYPLLVEPDMIDNRGFADSFCITACNGKDYVSSLITRNFILHASSMDIVESNVRDNLQNSMDKRIIEEFLNSYTSYNGGTQNSLVTTLNLPENGVISVISPKVHYEMMETGGLTLDLAPIGWKTRMEKKNE